MISAFKTTLRVMLAMTIMDPILLLLSGPFIACPFAWSCCTLIRDFLIKGVALLFAYRVSIGNYGFQVVGFPNTGENGEELTDAENHA